MREFTTPERNRMRSLPRRYHARLEVRNIDGTWIDVSNRLQGVSISGSRDNPVVSATFTLIKVAAGQSGSPLFVSSLLNRDDADEYAPLFNNGNRIRFHAAVTAPSTAPVTEDWKHLFEGRIDRPDWPDRTKMTLTCRDLGAYLLDNIIDEKRIYSTAAGSYMEVIQQQLIDDNDGNATLVIPDPPDPAWVITEYEQPLDVSVMAAVINLSDQIGWDTRYDYQSSNNFPELLLRDVDRAKTVADDTFNASEYKDVPVMGMDDEGVRNDIKGWYSDASIGGKLTFRRVKHPGSILAYGRKFMQIAAPFTDGITTPERMDGMLTAMLADLAVPWADKSVVSKLWWPAQLGDLYAYAPNDNHYDEEQKFSVVAYQHDFGFVNNVFTGDTTLTLRGQPSGGYRKWLEKAGPPGADETGLPNPKFGLLVGEGSALGGTANDGRIWWEVEFDDNTEYVVVWAEESEDENVPTPDIGSTVETSITLFRPDGVDGRARNFRTYIPIAIRPNYYARVIGAGFNKLNQRGPLSTPDPVQAIDNTPPYVDGTISALSIERTPLQDGYAVTATVATLDPDTESWLFIERDNVVIFMLPLLPTDTGAKTWLDISLLTTLAVTYNAYIWTHGQSGPPWAWVENGQSQPLSTTPKFIDNTPRAVANAITGQLFTYIAFEMDGTADPVVTAVELQYTGDLINWFSLGEVAIDAVPPVVSLGGTWSIGGTLKRYYRLVSKAGAIYLTYTPPVYFPGAPWVLPGGPGTEAPILTHEVRNVGGFPRVFIKWTCENAQADYLILQKSAPDAGVWVDVMNTPNIASGEWMEANAFASSDWRMQAWAANGPAPLATSTVHEYNGL